MTSPRLRLRTKLLLVALALLAIPWVGYRYVRAMEGFLRQGQEATLMGTARAVATVLDDRPKLMEPQVDLLGALREDRDLYAYPLHNPIQLDGYDEDWSEYLGRAITYGPDHRLSGTAPAGADGFSFRNLVGIRGNYLYALFLVKDPHIVYRAPNSLRLDQSDHLIIALQDPQGAFHRYLLTTRAPGWVNAYAVTDADPSGTDARPEVRIQGEWQEAPGGYTIELRMPLSMVGDKLAFAIADVDDPVTRRVREVIGTAGTRRLADLGTVMTPSPRIQAILHGLGRANARLWVLNRQGRVLALTGSLRPPDDQTLDTENVDRTGMLSGLQDLIYGLILRQPSDDFDDALAGASRLQGVDVRTALAGRPAIRWRHTPDGQAAILSAAYPIHDGSAIAGAVVAEQTGNAILTVRNRAMESLFNLTLVVFAAATLALLAFASRLSARIRRLRNDTEQAIGSDGRV
ncbi:MAG: proteobacterial dedicated sortase system histidine kinase, partial [Gammaproteobacteria bacterium]